MLLQVCTGWRCLQRAVDPRVASRALNAYLPRAYPMFFDVAYNSGAARCVRALHLVLQHLRMLLPRWLLPACKGSRGGVLGRLHPICQALRQGAAFWCLHWRSGLGLGAEHFGGSIDRCVAARAGHAYRATRELLAYFEYELGVADRAFDLHPHRPCRRHRARHRRARFLKVELSGLALRDTHRMVVAQKKHAVPFHTPPSSLGAGLGWGPRGSAVAAGWPNDRRCFAWADAVTEEKEERTEARRQCRAAEGQGTARHVPWFGFLGLDLG